MLKRRNRHPCLPLGVKLVVFVLGDPAGWGGALALLVR